MRRKISGTIAFLVLAIFAAIAAGSQKTHQDPAPSADRPYAFTDDGYLRVELASVKRTGNKVNITLTYENLANEDRRMAIYHGGASGRDTMLIDNEGETWDLLKSYQGGSKGPADKIFVPGVKVSVPITFTKATGKVDVKSFTLKSWVHILSSHGTSARPHWTNVTMKDIPSNYGH